jgi:NADH:ubiquinone oxidoreductase subunit 6 (subunit J)
MIVIYFRSKDIRGKGSFKNTIHQLKKAWRRIWRTYCLKIFIPAILFILLVIPLLLVAFRLSNSAVNWNAGPHNEFLLKIGANAPILEKISYFISFYSRNTFIVIASHLSPVTTDNLFYTLLAILFFIFFIFGLYRMLSSTEPLVRYIGIFIIGALLFFFAVVAIGKMTLSPTRHTLILMPFFIIPIAFGIVNTRLHFTKKHFAKKAGRQKTYSAILPIIAAVGLLLLFILNYASFSSQRIDPFSEKELEDTLATYNVSTLVAHSFTENILLMNGIIKEYNVFKDSEWVSTGKKDYNGRLLFISQRDSLNESVFTILKNRINARNGVSGQPIAGSWNDYEIIYSKEINSSVSIELSPLTKNGYNSLYIYVVALKREK